MQSKTILCIAQTKKELKLWLESEPQNRDNTIWKQKTNGDNKQKDKDFDDYPRLGYVAFSRAKELLCIACLEEIDPDLIKKLKDLDVFIYHSGFQLFEGI